MNAQPIPELFSKALAETISWCSSQPLTSQAQETTDEIRRRGLLGEAQQLLVRAQKKYREAYNKPEWQQAMQMLKEASPDSLAPLEKQLRTPDLKPLVTLGDIHWATESVAWEAYSIDAEAQRQKAVTDVISRRSKLLTSRGLSAEKDISEEQGRLLIYFPSENVSDGASKYSSKGFFDAFDGPPWDTWIYYSDRRLISWVPADCVSLANDGIDANIVDCIRWANPKSMFETIW